MRLARTQNRHSVLSKKKKEGKWHYVYFKLLYATMFSSPFTWLSQPLTKDTNIKRKQRTIEEP